MNNDRLDKEFLDIALDLAKQSVLKYQGGPFGAIVVKDNKIIGTGFNQVTVMNDPTAHAEIIAIRDACKNLGSFQLSGCTIYSSCEPCPMCLGAMYWARPERLVFSLSRSDASAIGFDDQFIYNEIALPYFQRKIKTEQIYLSQALEIFNIWKSRNDKMTY